MAKRKPDHDKGNLNAARIILADPERYAVSPANGRSYGWRNTRGSPNLNQTDNLPALDIAVGHGKGGA